MHDIPLNDTQRIFADKNHNLVYKFLHEKNLPASEYYDIVIFGYLRAVQRYLTDPISFWDTGFFLFEIEQ